MRENPPHTSVTHLAPENQGERGLKGDEGAPTERSAACEPRRCLPLLRLCRETAGKAPVSLGMCLTLSLPLALAFPLSGTNQDVRTVSFQASARHRPLWLLLAPAAGGRFPYNTPPPHAHTRASLRRPHVKSLASEASVTYTSHHPRAPAAIRGTLSDGMRGNMERMYGKDEHVV